MATGSTWQTDHLLEAARLSVGVDDVDCDSFRPGLECLVGSIEEEAALNDIGRAALEAQIVGNLANRLAVERWVGEHPAATEAPVERPVFVIGLPRTGTTLLSGLLDQDPSHRSLMRWEAQSSLPPPTSAGFATDPRIAATQESQAMLDTLNPGFKAIHFDAPDGPTECVALLSQDFKSILWETVANVPTYGRWLAAVDYRSAYRYHRRALKLLQSSAPGRWMLKSPGHCLAPEVVLETYPDASFVATHRDPATVVASTCSLVQSLSGTFTDADHRSYIAAHWSERVEAMLETVTAFRESDPAVDARFLDIPYQDLLADPQAALGRIYDHIGAELTGPVKGAVDAYLAENPQGRFGHHRYRCEELGLDPEDLHRRFAAYRERFGVPADALV